LPSDAALEDRLLMDNGIIIVSGLPRSGTSLMMQMLDYGGVPVVTDYIRTADQDNPRGYYEYERVKRMKDDVSWLPEARGKAIKMVSQLLHELPSNERYRIIFMERDLDEMIVSQDKMLARLNKPSAPRGAVAEAFRKHLRRVRAWLLEQPNFAVLFVSYNDLVERPDVEAERVGAFLEGKADPRSMLKAVDPALYRNRKTLIDGSGEPVAGGTA
jgi:Sulfotransferase domain